VIAHPCLGQFWINAERPMVVNFKIAHSNQKLAEWYRRLVELNGGREFQEVGFEICEELDDHFSNLDLARLQEIGRKYEAEFYLVRSERVDLAPFLVHDNQDYYLYRIPGS
jgi:hypothetical protein